MDHMTAKVSCFARAYHFEENETHIFPDSMAKKILGKDYGQIAESMMQGIGFFLPGFQGTNAEGLRLIVDRQLSPSVLGRSAFCEKKLREEMEKGCTQVLIFASGYDTFSLRNDHAAVTVYELDLPEMLEDKKKRVENAACKAAAKYVPCDLSDESWTEKLAESGFQPSEKTFGSLLGICYYLEKKDWEKLLKRAAGMMPAGSCVCFDFPANDESREARVNQTLARGAGEQMKAQYTYEEMAALLSACGFSPAEQLGAAEMTEQYFADYNKNNPRHPIAAPAGVGYIFAVKN